MARARALRADAVAVKAIKTGASKIYIDDHGHEMKAFSALDGVGLNLLARADIVVGWITGSAAPAVVHRARKLGVAHVVMDAADKLAAWESLRAQLGIAPEACAHIGDDLPDVPVFRACGFALTVVPDLFDQKDNATPLSLSICAFRSRSSSSARVLPKSLTTTSPALTSTRFRPRS